MRIAMAMIYLLLLSCFIGTLTSAHPTYELRKARYCENHGWFWCRNWKNSDLGQRLADAGITEDQRDRIYYSIFSQPTKKSIKYIALFSAGQQGLIGEDEFSDMMTGSIKGWRKVHGKSGEKANAQFHSGSNAVQFHQNSDGDFWPASETLIISFPNHNFNHLHTIDDKANYLNGYANYINSVVSWSRIEGIYLGGYSRGGCFSLRLAQILQRKFGIPNVKFIIQSVDGVCRWDQSELGTSAKTMENPLNDAPDDYKAFTTDINSQFDSWRRKNFCIRHLSGGEDIARNLGLMSWVYTFSHETSTTPYNYLQTEDGFKWYQQQWTKYGHGTLRDDYSKASEIITPMQNHFKSCKNQFW